MTFILPLSQLDEAPSASTSFPSEASVNSHSLTGAARGLEPNAAIVSSDSPNLLALLLKDIKEIPYNKSGRPKTPSGNYARDWPAYKESQANEQPLFKKILDSACGMIVEPEQGRGRPKVPLADIIFSLAYMIYNNHPVKRFDGYLTDLNNEGFISRVPCGNTLNNYLRQSQVETVLTSIIELLSLPLRAVESDFSVDATGLTPHRYARWVEDRNQDEKKRLWVKLHLTTGNKSNIVTAALVTRGHDADGPKLGHLLEITKSNFKMSSVSADSAYLSGKNVRLISMAGALPLIEFKSNNVLDPQSAKSTLWIELLRLFLQRPYVYVSYYNMRNNVEATFSMIKRKLHARIFSVNRQAQVNEVLLKVLCHNICVLIRALYELKIDITFPAGTSISTEKKETEPAEVPITGGRIIAVRGKRGGRKNPTENSNNKGHQLQMSLFD